MKPVISDTFFRDLIWNAPWITNKEEYLMSTLCCMLEEYPDYMEDHRFSAAFDNALLLFAASSGRWDYDTNKRLIYNEPVQQMMIKYCGDGLDFLKSLIYGVKNGILMHRSFPITSNPLNQELLELILENNAQSGIQAVSDHLTDNGIFHDSWRLAVAEDADLVRRGDKPWSWFYETHRNDPLTMEPHFEDPLLKEVWSIFEEFRRGGEPQAE